MHACNTAKYGLLGLTLQMLARDTERLCYTGWLGALFVKEIWKPNDPSWEKTLMYE